MFLVTAPLLPTAFLVCYNCGVKPGVKLSQGLYTEAWRPCACEILPANI